jgi:transposase
MLGAFGRTAGAQHASSRTGDTEQREFDRLKMAQAIVEMGLKPGRAAERLGLSVRQMERLVIRYRASGAAGLCSGRRERPGNRKLDEGLAVRALTIIRERYADFGPTLACEKLRECHGIMLSKETVRHLMTEAGLWIPRRQRPPKDLPAAGPACVPGRAGPDRRQRSPVVRGPGAGLRAAGVCR